MSNPPFYLPRIVDQQLEKQLGRMGAVLIQGAKWCGKTTTGLHQAKKNSPWKTGYTSSLLAACPYKSYLFANVRTMKFEHRRADGELLGWIASQDDAFVAIDLLGRHSSPATLLDCEEHLENLGLSYLAEPYLFRIAGDWVQVRLVEVNSERIVVKEEDFGDVTAGTPKHTLPFPPGEKLLPVTHIKK